MPQKDTLSLVKRHFYLTFTAIGVIMLVVGAIWAVGQIWTPISIMLVSAFLVFILRTPVAFFEKKGVPRVLGAAIMYIVALMVISIIGLIFVPIVSEQLVSFIGMAPQYIQNASSYFSQTFTEISTYLADSGIQGIVSTIGEEIAKWATTFASNSASAMFNTASTIGTLFLIAGVSFVVGFWVLKDLPKFSKELYKIVGPKHEEDVHVISRAFSRALGGYLRGMVVSCLCTGTMAFIAYTIVGVPYAAVLALFTGLMVFIPFIGPAIAWILAGVVGLLTSPITGALAALLTIASQMINDNVISPRVMGGSVELHPGIILVAIFTGAALGGVFGMLCAIPLTSAAKTIFVYYFEKRTGRQLVSEEGALFKGHPTIPLDPKSDAIPSRADDTVLSDSPEGAKETNLAKGAPEVSNNNYSEKTAEPKEEKNP